MTSPIDLTLLPLPLNPPNSLLVSCPKTHPASSFYVFWASSILTRSYAILDVDWDDCVRSKDFDDHCNAVSNCRSSRSGFSDSSVHDKPFQDDDASGDTSVASSVHDVPKLEKHLYYFDIRGDGRLGPKLIYRTSKDTFTPPTGPENEPRRIRLLQVDDHAQLGQDDLWATVRNEVRDLLEA